MHFIVEKINGGLNWLLLGDVKSIYAKRYFKVFLTLLVLTLWITTVYRATRGHGSQFDDFTEFSEDLLFNKVNVYEVYVFNTTSIGKYPPFFAMVYALLVPLHLLLGASAWFWINLLLIYFSAVAIARATWLFSGKTEESMPVNLWVAPVLLISTNVITNIETSQVNIFILSLVAFALYYFAKNKDAMAGVLLGIAVAIKITPALFVAYFAYKRSWKIVFWSGATVVACWGIVMLLVLGYSRYPEIMRSWLAILTGYVEGGTIKEGLTGFRHTNQSLDAFFFRTFTKVSADGGFGNFYINLVSLPLTTAGWIVKGLKLAIVAGMVYLFRQRIVSRQDARIPFELGLVAMAMLFISPISWINHYVIMLLPMTVAVNYLRVNTLAGFTSSPIKKAVLACSLSLLLPQIIFQAFSIPFLGALALAIVFVMLLAKEEVGVASAS